MPAPVAAAVTVIVLTAFAAPAASLSATAQSSPSGFCRRNAAAMCSSIEPAPKARLASATPLMSVGTSAATLPAARRWPINSERNVVPGAPARSLSIST